MNYGLLGEKLGHSFSKEIHAKLFDYEYQLCEIKRDNFDSFMKQKAFKAVNVTIPYKEQIIPYLDFVDETAKKIGAVNTVVNKDGRLYGYNTDYLGMRALILKNGIDLENKKMLVLGSGGTSKTAFAVAESLGAKEVYRVSRSGRDGCITYEDAQNIHADAEIIINTTPCGMYPNINTATVDVSKFKSLSGVIDAVYNPLNSKLVCDAKARGIKAVGGLYMLVAQAAYAAEYFTGKSVPSEKIDEIYKEMFSLKQNIVLIGMPGSGKSTIGKLLAEALGMQFVDTDEVIVKNEGKAIPDIFAELGEERFRDMESAAVLEVAGLQHTVIATGGGAVLRKENVKLLRENGRIYFIDRPLSSIVATSDRPLSSNREALEKRYNERYDIYCESADVHLKAGDDVCENAQKIKEDFLNENTCN
ncbi:MAG: shikimate dehydrogenase [Oscillospiraceae bacterium]|nr:shikimate dehydrogenase [Oscillospiraceae bacterium]